MNELQRLSFEIVERAGRAGSYLPGPVVSRRRDEAGRRSAPDPGKREHRRFWRSGSSRRDE